MTADQIIQLLDELARRLDGPAKYVFELAVRQSVIQGAIPWIVAALSLPLAFVTARRVADWEEVDMPAVVSLIAGAFGIVSLVASLISLDHLLNPEWVALNTIVDTLKP